MKIEIDLDGPLPPFAQLVAQIRAGVRSGCLPPGQALPSIRQLANDLDLNHNTVAKAYRKLERDAIIETKGYRGTFVRSDAVENSETDVNAWATGQLTDALSRFRDAGLTDSEIRSAFAAALKA